ncbi:MAG: hypothetical protein PUJ35_09575 [Ruminococcus bromii]|nr:hypothetical protein [Ruminococcus bromii]
MVQKREWAIPQTFVQQFAANEYVAACGDENRVFKFTCDAGGGKSGTVYLETNGQEGLQIGWGGDTYLSLYHACGATHDASTQDDFLNGYYVTISGGVTPVIVWRGSNNDNTHCTTNLDMSSWVTAKS